MTTAHHWILTAHGTDQTLTNVQQLLLGQASPRIETIAHSLAQINRFTGHCARPYSVAEHSVLVCDMVAGMGLGLDAQLLALMHDAHECVVGDVAAPLKHTLGVAWPCVENLHAFGLRVAYGLVDAHAAHATAVKTADLMALAIERRGHDHAAGRWRHSGAWPSDLGTAGFRSRRGDRRPRALADIRRRGGVGAKPAILLIAAARMLSRYIMDLLNQPCDYHWHFHRRPPWMLQRVIRSLSPLLRL